MLLLTIIYECVLLLCKAFIQFVESMGFDPCMSSQKNTTMLYTNVPIIVYTNFIEKGRMSQKEFDVGDGCFLSSQLIDSQMSGGAKRSQAPTSMPSNPTSHTHM